MLKDIIPAEWRKPIYAVYAVIGFLLGSIAIALEPDPAWLVTAFAIYAYTGTAIGAVATGNTPVNETYVGERLEVDDAYDE